MTMYEERMRTNALRNLSECKKKNKYPHTFSPENTYVGETDYGVYLFATVMFDIAVISGLSIFIYSA